MDVNELQRWLQRQTELWQRFCATQNEVDAEGTDWRPLYAACQQLADEQGISLQSELAEAMTAQLQGFCRFGLQLLSQLREPDGAGSSLEGLVADLSQHLQQQALGVLLRQWRLPDSLARLASAGAPQAEAINPFEPLRQLLQQLAQQSKQPRLAVISEALSEFQHSLSRYQNRLQRVHRQASQALLLQLQSTPPPSSLAELHAAWVDCYETAYAEMLRQPAYQQLYAELTNHSLRLTQLGRDYWSAEYRQLGLVPQQDYDALLQRHHQLRKQLQRSAAQQLSLNARLEALEQQLRDPSRLPPADPTAKPAVAALRKRKA